jgi:hypothetical protein
MKISNLKVSPVDEYARRGLSMKCEFKNTHPTPIRFVRWTCVAFGDDGIVLGVEEGSHSCRVGKGESDTIEPDFLLVAGMVGKSINVEMTADFYDAEEIELGSAQIPDGYFENATIASGFSVLGIEQSHPVMLSLTEPDESEEDQCLLSVSGCLIGLHESEFRDFEIQVEVRKGKKVVASSSSTKELFGTCPFAFSDGLWDMPKVLIGNTCFVRLTGYRRFASASGQASVNVPGVKKAGASTTTSRSNRGAREPISPGSTYKVEPVDKKTIVETERFAAEDGRMVAVSKRWRFGTYYITPQDKSEADLLEAARSGDDILCITDFEQYEPDCVDDCVEVELAEEDGEWPRGSFATLKKRYLEDDSTLESEGFESDSMQIVIEGACEIVKETPPWA